MEHTEIFTNYINEAKMKLIKNVQSYAYKIDNQRLKDGNLSKSESILISLNQILHQDILRVGGRLKHVNFKFVEKIL